MKKESKNQSSKFSNIFSGVLVISVIAATLINAILVVSDIIIFWLNENQFLYLFSCMAQVIGGVFGLTLTAYVFFVDKFRKYTSNDETLYDATNAILKRYFHILILLATTTGATIFFCILGIIDLHNWMSLYPIIINESIFLFLIGLIAVLIFGVMLLDPQKLDKEIEKMKRDVEKYYQTAENSMSGDFSDFLRTYNQLEQLLVNFAEVYMKHEILQAPYRSYISYHRPQIIQVLRVLNSNQIIPSSLQNELNELRMYRNALVHGVDFKVSKNACTRISQIYDTLKSAFDTLQECGKDSKEYEKAIQQIYGLSQNAPEGSVVKSFKEDD